MSEITDEEVDYGSSNIVENSSDINSDHAWSTQRVILTNSEDEMAGVNWLRKPQ